MQVVGWLVGWLRAEILRLRSVRVCVLLEPVRTEIPRIEERVCVCVLLGPMRMKILRTGELVCMRAVEASEGYVRVVEAGEEGDPGD